MDLDLDLEVVKQKDSDKYAFFASSIKKIVDYDLTSERVIYFLKEELKESHPEDFERLADQYFRQSIAKNIQLNEILQEIKKEHGDKEYHQMMVFLGLEKKIITEPQFERDKSKIEEDDEDENDDYKYRKRLYHENFRGRGGLKKYFLMVCSNRLFDFYKFSSNKTKNKKIYPKYIIVKGSNMEDNYPQANNVLIISEDQFIHQDDIIPYNELNSIWFDDVVFRDINIPIPNREYLQQAHKLIIISKHTNFSLFNLRQFQNVKELYIHDDPETENFITQIPDDICQLSNLKSLFIHLRQLNALPDFFESFHKLEKVTLNACNLSDLPPTLINHTNVRFLYVNSQQVINKINLQNMNKLDILSLNHYVTSHESNNRCKDHIIYKQIPIPVDSFPDQLPLNLKLFLTSLCENNFLREWNSTDSIQQDQLLLIYSENDLDQLRSKFCKKLILFASHFEPNMQNVEFLFKRFLYDIHLLGGYGYYNSDHIWDVNSYLFSIILEFPDQLNKCNHYFIPKELKAIDDLFTHYVQKYPSKFGEMVNLEYILDYEVQEHTLKPIDLPESIKSLPKFQAIFYPYENYYGYDKVSPTVKKFIMEKVKTWVKLYYDRDLWEENEIKEGDDMREIFTIHLTKNQLLRDEIIKINKINYPHRYKS